MKSTFIPSEHEQNIQKLWEKKELAKPKSNKNPYTILMPPPNANASLHAGHGMYCVDDVMIRYKRLRGFDSLWIPGVDHAGFETQYVYEKYLGKQGKSRFDYDRATFYKNTYRFVQDNSGLIYSQLKRLGFLADWERSVFALDPHVIEYVYETFSKMHTDGLIYKDEYLVNYCTHCGTTLAELEIKYVERSDPLYYLIYGPFTLATVRPETKFGDTAVAVNPKDKRYAKWIGKKISVEGLLGEFSLNVIADDFVDASFGTGVVKITPAHDPVDYTIGKKHNLEIKQISDISGRLTQATGLYAGMKVKEARSRVVEDLTQKGLIKKIDNAYIHSVATCYKCGRDIEPLILPNWFVKVDQLKKPAVEAVSNNDVQFFPKKHKKIILDWFKAMHDWPISRQIAWGIRIPIWYEVSQNPNIYVVFLDKNNQIQKGLLGEVLKTNSLSEIQKGLQSMSAPKDSIYQIATVSPGSGFIQETDTFDTWFSSGQWPLITLNKEEYKSRFPTDFMGTLSDILKFWISRMIMFSLYRKNEIPFKHVYLWPMVSDSRGIKMSKSKGNVINPIDLVNIYGADAFRGSLFFGVGAEGKVILSEDKVRAMRNYVNKIWNIGRFITLTEEGFKATKANEKADDKIVEELNDEFNDLCKKYIRTMEAYQFSVSYGLLYEFIWHRFADYYIEKFKSPLQNGDKSSLKLLKRVFLKSMQMLHPFLPFITEALWMQFNSSSTSILESALSD